MMRAILLDWMMEVSSEFLMKRETYHLAVMYVDKYLSKLTILKQELQLLGVTSMFIASKMEVYIISHNFLIRKYIQPKLLILVNLQIMDTQVNRY